MIPEDSGGNTPCGGFLAVAHDGLPVRCPDGRRWKVWDNCQDSESSEEQAAVLDSHSRRLPPVGPRCWSGGRVPQGDVCHPRGLLSFPFFSPLVKGPQSCLTLRAHGLYGPWNSPGQNTGVGSCSLLQGIFPTQGSNPDLSHCTVPPKMEKKMELYVGA